MHVVILVIKLETICIVKGAVRQYCFYVKPFNLLPSFITKCDAKCYDAHIKMADDG